MRVFYTDTFQFDLPEGHRFPLEKYALLRKALRESPEADDFIWAVPERATRQQLELAHAAEYVSKVLEGCLDPREIRRMGLPWSPELVERSLRSVGSTLAASSMALEDGLACSLAGGTHHAGRAHGEGFCVFNDVAVAARSLLANGAVRRAAVIDCDVHQGNGTAAILANDEAIFTFSIHGQKNFPYRKYPSDLDLGLEDGTGDALYLDMLEEALGRVFLRSRPEFVFYLAGADPHQHDMLGRLSLTKNGLMDRDKLVFSQCAQAGIPVVVLLSGGYGRDIHDSVAIHRETVRLALKSLQRSVSI